MNKWWTCNGFCWKNAENKLLFDPDKKGFVVAVVVVWVVEFQKRAGPNRSTTTTTITSKLVREVVIQRRHSKLITGYWQWVGRRFHDR